MARTRILQTGDRQAARAGFTLVELVVVIVLVAVLAGMALPSIAGSWGRANLRGSARDLLVAAQYTHHVAVTRAVRCRLVLDAQRNQFVIEYEREPGLFVPVSADLTRPMSLNRNVQYGYVRIEPTAAEASSAGAPQNFIIFEPSGRADAAVVEITDGKASWTLRIAPATGRAMLSEGRVTDLLNDRMDLDVY